MMQLMRLFYFIELGASEKKKVKFNLSGWEISDGESRKIKLNGESYLLIRYFRKNVRK